MKKFLLYVAIIGCLGCFSFQVQSAELSLSQKITPYYLKEERVDSFIKRILSSNGKRVGFLSEIDATISGKFVESSPRELFDELVLQYNLIWYYDGYTVYIAESKDSISRVINLGDIGREQLESKLKSLGLDSKNNLIRGGYGDSVVYISGHPKWVETVQSVLSSMSQGNLKSNATVVRIFPLRYVSLAQNGQSTDSTPPIVLRMKRILGISDSDSLISNSRNSQFEQVRSDSNFGVSKQTPMERNLQGSTASGDAKKQNSLSVGNPAVREQTDAKRSVAFSDMDVGLRATSAKLGRNIPSFEERIEGRRRTFFENFKAYEFQNDVFNSQSNGRSIQTGLPFGSSSLSTINKIQIANQAFGGGSRDWEVISLPTSEFGFRPIIDVDLDLNAIIVRDYPDRIEMYRAIIEQLDVRPALVQIDASIMDISSEDSLDLGVNWRFDNNYVSGIGGNQNLPGVIVDPSARNASGVINGNNLQGGSIISAILGKGTHQLLLKVQALSKSGKAKVTAQPKVVTLNHQAATITSNENFYVKVAGNNDSNLYSVSAGISMVVTPHLISDNGKKIYRLDIKIEDGSVQSRTIDGIPTTKKSQLLTQAIVQEGESLLIAGHSTEIESNADAGVPFLSSLPLIGHLFKVSQKTNTRADRYYLITPKFI